MESYNNEHYPDPTPQIALAGIQAEVKVFRPLIYVCSPFAGDTEKNSLAARRYCRFVLEHGGIPLAPHLFFPQFMDDRKPEERALGLHFSNVLMGFCREMWIFGENISDGMEREIKRARWKNLVQRHFNERLEEKR